MVFVAVWHENGAQLHEIFSKKGFVRDSGARRENLFDELSR